MSNVYLNWFTTDEHFPFFIQYGGHEEDTSLHQHADFSELVIVLNGHAAHIVNDEEAFIKKGNVFVINGGTPMPIRTLMISEFATLCTNQACLSWPDRT